MGLGAGLGLDWVGTGRVVTAQKVRDFTHRTSSNASNSSAGRARGAIPHERVDAVRVDEARPRSPRAGIWAPSLKWEAVTAVLTRERLTDLFPCRKDRLVSA